MDDIPVILTGEKRVQPLFEPDTGNSWDSIGVVNGYVIKIGDMYKLFYTGSDGIAAGIGIAE